MHSSPSTVGSGPRIVAFGLQDLNPFTYLGDQVTGAAKDGWIAAMTGLWSASLWLLELAFKIIDAFATPDVSSDGPLHAPIAYSAGIGAGLVGVLMFAQLGLAAFRRDGKSLGELLVGIFQFGLVWIGFIGIAALLVAATAGLTQGLLSGLLHVDSWSDFNASDGWPRSVTDITVATVLGLCGIFLVIPAAVSYLLLMMARAAALLILVATSPISAAGLVMESTKAWFWKSLRWFLAANFSAPAAALVLGIGVALTNSIPGGAGVGAGVAGGTGQVQTTSTEQAVGTAVIGSLLILIGAMCPLVLFRLLSFVDPSTAAGQTMRSSLSSMGGIGGMLGGGGSAAASGSAGKSDSQGRSDGESSSAMQTASRLAGPIGEVSAAAGSVASRAAEEGTSTLAQAGVGHNGGADGGMTPTQAGPPGARTQSRPAGDPGQAGSAAPAGGGAPGGDAEGEPPGPSAAAEPAMRGPSASSAGAAPAAGLGAGGAESAAAGAA